MKPPAVIERHRSEIDIELKNVIDSRRMPLYEMMKYHLGWTDIKGNPVQQNRGKALRPALCLFSCEAAGGDYHKALPAAAAVELVHNFSLIIDDIQDDDAERRHRATIWAVWGKPQAINAGIAMRILANTAVSRLQKFGISAQKLLHINQRLDEMSLRLIEGQYLDISFENRFDIKVDDYLEMIKGKTGALISGSMELGAFLGTDNEAIVNGFRDIGMDIGLAFQIKDDILGIWGNEAETGKPSGNDIRRRKKSFPVVYALGNVDGKSKKELLAVYRNTTVDEKEIGKVHEIFERAGAKTKSQQLVAQYCDEAGKAFSRMDLNQQSRDDMEEIIRFLNNRNY